MAFKSAKCIKCGSDFRVNSFKEDGVCEFCGTPYITREVTRNYYKIVYLDAKLKNAKEFADKTFKDLGNFYSKQKWIYPALFVYKAMKEKIEVEELCQEQGYEKSQVYNYNKAGKKLLEGKYDKLPLTLTEFLSIK